MRIVALFSIDNTQIDQPSHNLVAFWDNDPQLQDLAAVTNVNLGKASSDVIVASVELWQKKAAKIHGVTYWLAWIESGKPMPSPPEAVNEV